MATKKVKKQAKSKVGQTYFIVMQNAYCGDNTVYSSVDEIGQGDHKDGATVLKVEVVEQKKLKNIAQVTLV